MTLNFRLGHKMFPVSVKAESWIPGISVIRRTFLHVRQTFLPRDAGFGLESLVYSARGWRIVACMSC